MLKHLVSYICISILFYLCRAEYLLCELVCWRKRSTQGAAKMRQKTLLAKLYANEECAFRAQVLVRVTVVY